MDRVCFEEIKFRSFYFCEMREEIKVTKGEEKEELKNVGMKE
jgi:hypothetical protein